MVANLDAVSNLLPSVAETPISPWRCDEDQPVTIVEPGKLCNRLQRLFVLGNVRTTGTIAAPTENRALDDVRFDNLTRTLGATRTRRSAIKLAATSIVGVFSAMSSLPNVIPASAQAGSTCAAGGAACEMVEGSCCAPYTCFEAICDIPRGCVGTGLPCVDDVPCCTDEALSCVDGICAPATDVLPAAGVGIPHDTGRVAGLGLAAAAVLVAGKLIRDKERDPEL